MMREPPISSLATTTDTVVVDETLCLHVASTGRGDRPILFVPGWSMSSDIFERQFAHFENSQTYRFISFDPRGQGRSSRPFTTYTSAARGSDIACVMDQLDLEDAVLAGWSQGVHDVLAYIEACGVDRLSAVVLIDGAPRATGKDKEKEWVWYREDDADGYTRLLSRDLLDDPEGVSRRFAISMLENPAEDDVDWVVDIMLQMPPEVGAFSSELDRYDNFEQTLIETSKTRPTLIVAAEEKRDVAVPWIDRHAPDAAIEIFGAHMMFWEHADRFNALFDEFLQGLSEKAD